MRDLSAKGQFLGGFIPKFADIETETLNIDPAKIEEAVTDDTRAIMVVHTMGKPCEMNRTGAYGATTRCRGGTMGYGHGYAGMWKQRAELCWKRKMTACSEEEIYYVGFYNC